MSDGSNISHSSSSLTMTMTMTMTNPALVALVALAAHPLLPAHPDQCSNDDKEKNKDDAGEDNVTRADACLVVVSLLFCFAADLCPALAEARTYDWLVFDDHVSENGDDEQGSWMINWNICKYYHGQSFNSCLFPS